MKNLFFSKKGIKSLVESMKKFLYDHCIIHLKKYPNLFYFIVTALSNTLLLRVLTVGNFFYLKPLFADLGMLFIFSSFMFLFKSNKKRNRYLIIVSFFITFICIVNSIYYTYYGSFVSVSLLATSIFAVDVGDAIIEQVLEFSDFLYLWQPLFLIFYYKRCKSKKSGKDAFKICFDFRNVSFENSKKNFRDMIISGVVILAMISLFFTKTEWGRLVRLWNRESAVSSFGILIYQGNDVCQNLLPKFNNLFGHDNAMKEVTYFYENWEVSKKNNEYSNVFEGMNVIVIHAESLQTLMLDLSFNNSLVAPTFNRLSNEGIYFSNFYSQVGVGTSSDAEFTFNTSLMPSSNGTVFVNYFDREYNTIQKAFNNLGYYTFSMHGNAGDFWNRAVMHENMGYNDFYSKTSFNIDETIGLGISDKSFFKQSVSIIEEIDKKDSPFYGTLITLSNHTPWSDLDLMDEYETTWTIEIDDKKIVREYLNNTTLGNYIRSVHYMDQAMEQFITDLDRAGILDNTVLVIYGDHYPKIDRSDYNLMYNYDPYSDSIKEEDDEEYIDYNEYEYELDKSVPFIIWTKNKIVNKEIVTPTGMIDVYPILANLFGLEVNEYQLGHDILGNSSDDNTVVFTDGSYITSKIYYNGQNGEIYSIDGGAVDEDYIKENSLYADDLISVSNNIITYDLIKEIKEKDRD